MQSSLRFMAGTGVALTLIASVFASGASATRSHLTTSHQGTTRQESSAATASSCYSQLDNDNGTGIDSQKFESAYSSYDSRGADDFTLTAPCVVQSVDVRGFYFNGSGPLRNASLVIYADDAGTPGTVIARRLVGAAKVTDDAGNFTVPLARVIDLEPGVYWIGFRVGMAFDSGGEWGWYTNNTQRGNPSMWKNRGDGFATGCVTYTPTTTCIDSGEGGDYAFALNDG